MSGLAQLLLARGDKVCGSDLKESDLLAKIRRMGGTIRTGHSAAHLDHPDLVVYSSSISPANPELVAARNRGIPVFPRGQFLARLLSGRRTIAVAGSHGKSTTSALIARLLVRAGWDPLVALGAEVDSLGGNVRSGSGSYAVVEADESDNSFLWLEPAVAVITNIDEEHLDYFRNRREVEESYASFARRVPAGGVLIGCWDDPAIRRLLRQDGLRCIGYGLSDGADLRAADVRCEAGESRYQCVRAGRTLGRIRLRIPGLHNVVNSLAAVAVAEVLGIGFKPVAQSLEGYRGARRRFQIHGEKQGVLVVEDYGHHPAEISATLLAAHAWKGRRIRCLFQAHRYSRTRHLLDRFGSSFMAADEVILLPVYAASEDPLEGAGAEDLARAIRSAGRKEVLALSEPEAIAHLKSTAQSGDLILFMGAGSVGTLARQFWRRWRRC